MNPDEVTIVRKNIHFFLLFLLQGVSLRLNALIALSMASMYHKTGVACKVPLRGASSIVSLHWTGTSVNMQHRACGSCQARGVKHLE